MVDSYNIDTYFYEINEPERQAFPTGPVRVGDRAPSFALPSLDGDTISLDDLLARGHVVLVLGCFTAPPALAQLPELETLHRTYGGRGITFVYVYTREIHPGELMPPHETIEAKHEQAGRLRDHSRISFPVAVDDLAGGVHRAYGGLPSMAVIIHRDGTLIYRGSWTQARVLQPLLENLLRRDQAEAKGEQGRLAYHESIVFMEQEPREIWDLVALAGPKAVADLAASNRRPAGRFDSPFRRDGQPR